MELMDFLPKLLLASLIGGIIGIFRSKNSSHSSVGYGTLSVLTVGTTLLTIISKYCLGSGADPSRLIANIITAVGFLCGGVIFTKATDDDSDNQEVVGLTTGILIFNLSAIGIAIGLGYYGLAICAAIIVQGNIQISKLLKHRRKKNEDEL